jgi:hypothetical protein
LHFLKVVSGDKHPDDVLERAPRGHLHPVPWRAGDKGECGGEQAGGADAEAERPRHVLLQPPPELGVLDAVGGDVVLPAEVKLEDGASRTSRPPSASSCGG